MTIADDRRTTADFSLRDRYTAENGQILATGIQALVRLPIDLMRADRRAGHRTAAFIAGYQGSPLGGYDRELTSQAEILRALDIVHRPAVNEELGATAVMGSQLSMTFDSHSYDGVAGIWYGKSPGLDRAGDAIRHGNYAGTSRLSGVLALVGDDPACKSSTLPSRSDVTLAGLDLPIVYPGTIQDVIDLGLHGFALSRASGSWVSMKIVTAVADGSGLATVAPDRVRPTIPTIEIDGGGVWQPTLTYRIGPPHSLIVEQELAGHRWEMITRYVADNGDLNPMLVDPPDAWLGIIASGHIAEMVMEALRILGLDGRELHDLGVRVLKLGVLNPLDERLTRQLAAGTATVLVVEDKLEWLETRVRAALYGSASPPAIVGKKDTEGRLLVPATGALTADSLVEPLRRVLLERIGAERLSPPKAADTFRLVLGAEAQRTPFFCSGCPHNTGLLVPDGSLVGAGIGCHGMVSMIGRPETGDVVSITAMGGEGAQWVGAAPFVGDRHMFQNMGDGTFFHSGQLAIQYAVSAGVTVTFKILYNAAVAMTGGQDAAGVRPVPDVAAMLLAEGVERVIITTDDPGKYRGISVPRGVDVMHRDRIVEAQEQLRAIDGVTVLIHDQQCAAEKRRERKRGRVKQASFRVMIDERVCEGCGDCGVKSNCLSLHSIDTEFGRKTVIDQASCNIDASCLKGDCPAFVTVAADTITSRSTGAANRPIDPASLPEPARLPESATIRMPGIGGTGVVTVSQVLATAAKLVGKPSSSVDQTGLSQKAGPVVSTLTVGEATPGRVDVLLAFDPLSSATRANLGGLDPATSVAIVSTSVAPTGRMIGKVASMGIDLDPVRAEIDARTVSASNRYVDAAGLTTGLFGNSVTANVFVVGVAYQAGLIPLPADAIEQAIELNGAAVEANQTAFRWGRSWYVDPTGVEGQADRTNRSANAERFDVGTFDDAELLRLVEVRATDLAAYQDAKYARRYVAAVREAADAETAAAGDGSFARTVARQLHRLMAYKDEYEVARLLLDGRSQVREVFGDGAKATWNLHPPALRSMGLKRKMKFRPWTAPAMKGLRSMKRLRGTALDPFGRAEVRRTERALIDEYTTLVRSVLPTLATDHARAVSIAGLADQIRGFESVKMRNVEQYREAVAAALREV
ncbi:MAG TPA: indolepyruvate ferredoxin oxidoreductase family protein [Ilumatobacteraceae bacterium]|nr:indolepyruvate ferredoxin oxidoreductase family protein [Ilumatobacteraceae bacterium]